MGDSKLYFIVGSIAMITFITQIGAMAGSIIVTNAPDPPTPPTQPNWADYILMPVWNLGYFFQLMSVNSGYAWVGTVLSIWSIGIIWAVIELIRGV